MNAMMQFTKEQIIRHLKDLQKRRDQLESDIKGLETREGTTFHFLSATYTTLLEEIKETTESLEQLVEEEPISSNSDKLSQIPIVKDFPTSPYWKFRAVNDFTFKMLLNEELWFSHPNYFNDPFDTNLDIRKLIKELENKLLSAPLLKLEIECYLSAYKKVIENRFVFSANQGAPKYKPFEEVLMWSHYANEHKGICIGLSMESVLERLEHQCSLCRRKQGTEQLEKNLYMEAKPDLEVVYGRDYLENSLVPYVAACAEGGSSRTAKLIEENSFVKAKNWEYEHEHRFIFQDFGEKGRHGIAVPFNGEDIENIIFGLKISDTDKKAIKNIIKAGNILSAGEPSSAKASLI